MTNDAIGFNSFCLPVILSFGLLLMFFFFGGVGGGGKFSFVTKTSFRNNIRVSNSLDTDRARHLGYKQMTSGQRVK